MNDEVTAALELAKALSPGAYELALLVSPAPRIEQELVRAVRLAAAPQLDAGDEADLWFGPLIEARSSRAVTLSSGVAAALRDELAKRLRAGGRDGDRVLLAREAMSRVHASASPALVLEERVAWSAIEGNIGDALGETLWEAVAAAEDPDRIGVAQWALQAWPRLPEAARRTDAARRLREVSEQRLTSSETSAVPLLDLVPLTVQWSGRGLRFGDNGEGAVEIMVPRYDPCRLTVSFTREGVLLTTRHAELLLGDSLQLFGHGGDRAVIETQAGDVYEFDRAPELGAESGDEALYALAKLLTDNAARSGDNARIPAGYTFLAQFVYNDMTFDTAMPGVRLAHADAEAISSRAARLGLNALYGDGPGVQLRLYDNGVRLRIGRDQGGPFISADLPRDDDGNAIIADARNDENVIIAQLHLLFLRFHNKVVEQLGEVAEYLRDFDEARRTVVWHYQWIVLHDLVPRLVGREAARKVFDDSSGEPVVNRKLFLPPREIPAEFSAAAYRFGHSMVREDYRLRGTGTAVPLFTPRRPDGETLAGGRRIPRALEIEWGQFFELSDTPQLSRLIDTSIAAALDYLPDHGRLALLDLMAGRQHQLPSGQEVAKEVCETVGEGQPLSEAELEFGLSGIEDAEARAGLLEETPLWYYILLEAQLHGNGGEHLGPVGGRIVAEVLVGLLADDPESFLSVEPTWSPAGGRKFDMPALIRFVDDPAGVAAQLGDHGKAPSAIEEDVHVRAAGFRADVHQLLSSDAIDALVNDRMPALAAKAGHAATSGITERHVIPAFRRWRNGEIVTLNEMVAEIVENVHAELAAPEKPELLSVISDWQNELRPALEELTRPICLRWHLPPATMTLPAVSLRGEGLDVVVQSSVTTDLMGNFAGVATVVVGGVMATTLFGAGTALVAATGPVAVVIAFIVAVGVAAGLKYEVIERAQEANIPGWIRKARSEKRLVAKLREEAPAREAELSSQLAQQFLEDGGPALVRDLSEALAKELNALADEAERLIT